MAQKQINAKNIKAINTFAFPVLTYPFGVINASDTDREHPNRLNRTKIVVNYKQICALKENQLAGKKEEES